MAVKNIVLATAGITNLTSPLACVDVHLIVSSSRSLSLLDFKSQELAEQFTLIENDFYQRLELPELLIWSKEQNEEK